ncbi:MAG: ZinT/AdcA family metal-binding protein [Treponema sp.]|uniref:metal ABC transporter solute-binding protein, Zn/Mn family n=1 Tax=Treponema sp. TaxID=166 RepID=UPI0025FAF763|nr:ZinT/AdcA family metal-binding protein [Treponema sp.]MBQ9281157.1 ZinT/AdcA family metal-binding protein [Treponema sp.]
MKKLLAFVGLLLALGMGSAFAKKASDENKVKVVTTIFPEYDWVKEIVGEKAAEVELTLLLNNGVDLHSYQPSVKDIAKIQEADIFVYVGGESDEWVDDVLKNVKSPNQKVINLLEVLGDGVKAEEIVEGMEHEHHHGHDHDDDEHDHDDHDGDHHDEHGYDHEEHEHHGKEVKTFEDHDVKDRSLSDWAGEWQSPYLFVLDGSLDEAWEEKAEDGKKTAAEYKEYYKTGYKTDIASVSIKGDKITYKYDNGKTVSAKYKYVGYFIQLWSGGTKGAMYRFERTDKKSDAPKFIEINDHMIEPAKAEHFHLRMSNESFDAIVDPEKYWPTFFPASMSAHEIGEHLSGHHKHDEHAEHGHDEHHHDHEEELDEHVWLSLKNAQILTSAICDALCQADSKNAATYKKNLVSYNKKLADLDAKYEAAVKAASKDTLLFGDRFPFRYLVDDYGLKYFAAFSGCSAESEASFKTIVFLSEKVNELGLNSVCQIESGNGKIAKTVISNSKNRKAKVLTLDSLQSTTAKQIKKGATYLGAMEKNLEVLKEALR